MYPAIAIATLVINECYKMNIRLSNLKLNLLLYFVQGEYYHVTKTRLIKEDFYTHVFGPIIPSIQRRFTQYGILPLPKDNPISDSSVQNRVKSILQKYAAISVPELSQIAKKQEPYAYTKQTFGNQERIPFDNIESYFLSDRQETVPILKRFHASRIPESM